MMIEPFRDHRSQESHSTASLDQASQKAFAVRVQTHTVLSSPNLDDETVGSSMPSGKRKSDEIGNDTDLCLCAPDICVHPRGERPWH